MKDKLLSDTFPSMKEIPQHNISFIDAINLIYKMETMEQTTFIV